MSTALVDRMLLLGTTEEGRYALRDLSVLVAGAAFGDLALAGRLACPDRVVRVAEESPTGHPVLDALLARVAAVRAPRTAWRWILDSARPVLGAERDHLVEVGVLDRQQDTVLRVLPRVRHPLRDVAAREEALCSVRDVVLAEDPAAAAARADEGTRLLLGLLATAHHPRRTAAELFPELDAARLRARLSEARGEHWVVTATARAVTLTHAARAGAS